MQMHAELIKQYEVEGLLIIYRNLKARLVGPQKCLCRVKDASILSWPTKQGYLEAVDCRNHSVRYDMVLLSRAGLRLRCLIRSPTTL